MTRLYFIFTASFISLMALTSCAPKTGNIIESKPQKLTYYVSLDGSDDFSGTLKTVNDSGTDGPFATLEKARDTIRELKHTTGLPNGVVTVCLMPGTYYLDKRFELSPEDSGTSDSPIVYRSLPGTKVVISGAKKLTGWKKLPDQLPGLPESINDKLYYIDVEKGFHPHSLFINGKAQMLARYPNEGFFEGEKGLQGFGDPGPQGQLITFPDHVSEFLPYLPDNGDVEMSWIPIIWANGISVMKNFDQQTNTARRHSKNVLYYGSVEEDWRRGNRFRLQNAYVFIDTPGEWAVDTQKGRIYFYPPSPLTGSEQTLCSNLYELFRLEGNEPAGQLVHDIALLDLTFSHTDRMPEDQWPEEWLKRNFENPDAAVFLKDVRNIHVKRCRMLNVGTYGITLNKYAQNVTVEHNEIAYTGCGGVQLLGYGPGTKDVNKNNIIRCNLIHHCGNNDYMHSAAVSLYQSGGNTITHNYIYNCPYAAIVMVGAYFGDLNNVARGNWTPESQTYLGHTDAYGSFEHQYQVRWQDLPEGAYEEFLAGTGDFSELQFWKYLHCRNNYVAYNVASDCMNGLADGGALYCWCCSENNRWENNIVVNSGDKTIYLDDGIHGALIRGNIGWGKGGTITKGKNFWMENSFDYPERPAGYAELMKTIFSRAQAMGGWYGDTDLTTPEVDIQSRDGKIFFNRKLVTITKLNQNCDIYYTIDGTDPDTNSILYTGPFTINDTTIVKAAAFLNKKPSGKTHTVTFTKLNRPPKPDVPLTDSIYTNKVDYKQIYPGNKWFEMNNDSFNIMGKKFIYGIGLIGTDSLKVNLKPEYKKFVAIVGPDILSDPRAYAHIEILIDGEKVYRSQKMKTDSQPLTLEIEIPPNSKEMIIRFADYSNFYWLYVDLVHCGFLTK